MPHSVEHITRYKFRVERLRRKLNNLDATAAKRAFALLRDQRNEVMARLALIPRDSGAWDAHHLPQLLTATQDALETFYGRYRDVLKTTQDEAIDLGDEAVTTLLGEFEAVDLSHIGIDLARVEIAQGFTTDLVTNVTSTMQSKIAQEIQRGVLGGKSPWEMMQAIGGPNGFLKDKSIFRDTMLRAETIVRTEGLRVYSLATQSKLEQAAERVDGLMRQWHAALDDRTRASHAAANGQTRKVNEPYDVGGTKLMYPRDPAGPPGETINCRCDSLPWKKEWEGYGDVAPASRDR